MYKCKRIRLCLRASIVVKVELKTTNSMIRGAAKRGFLSLPRCSIIFKQFVKARGERSKERTKHPACYFGFGGY